MEKNLRQESSEVKKIVICGPESTGKSTLTQNLSSYYNTSFAKEFARDFLQHKWDITNTVCTKKDLIDIVKGPKRSRIRAKMPNTSGYIFVSNCISVRMPLVQSSTSGV